MTAPKPLDYVGARKAARALFGENGDVKTGTAITTPWYAVGVWTVVEGVRTFASIGIGPSWEAALEDAKGRQR